MYNAGVNLGGVFHDYGSQVFSISTGLSSNTAEVGGDFVPMELQEDQIVGV